VALGIAGLEAGKPSEVAPLTPSLQRGSDARAALRHYASTLRSLPEIDTAARGHGLLSADTEAGVVRRVPIVALVGVTPVLPLSLETLRLASGEPLFFVQGGVAGVEAVGIGDLVVPAQSDGRLWVHYTPHDASRFVSAADVLGDKADPAQLEGKLVLVGVTGLGLIDYQSTPLGERMPGIEIHAQVLENVFDGALLMRPRWATWVEGLALFVMGLVVVCSVPRLSPRRSTVLLLLLLVVLGAAGFGAYRVAGLLLDASVPGAAMEPAREVGGDLYDFFMLDAEHLFFLVGDVSGKGLPASIFMAVSKALCKSTALRRGRRVAELLREANAEIARENPEFLFVTVFAGVLDVRSGRLEYCSAGHEPPFVLNSDGEIARLAEGGGPPLCVLEGFSYVSAEHQMSQRGIVCVVSDGVTEAMN